MSVAAGTPAGNYIVTYTICELLNPSNCDTATVTVPVVASPIDAVNDIGNTVTGAIGGQSLINVLVNDTLNGIPATLATVNLTQVSTTNSGVTLNPVDGSVSVAAGTPGGNYIVTYTICELLNPTNCDTATVSVFVEAPSIALVKTIASSDENGDGLTGVGEKVIYHFAITNTGNVTLNNITIADLLPGIVITGGPITLSPGAVDTTTFEAVYIITANDLLVGSVSNQATVYGTSPLGIIVQDLSDHSSILGDESTILVITRCNIEVFNAVSPNDDGENDEFRVEGLECYPENSVEIYNRWGVLVFEREKYNNADRAFRGISEGRVTIKQSEELPEGTYFYIIKYTKTSGITKEKAGYLYINRK